MPDYRKLQAGDAGYELIQAYKSLGFRVCDSYDHNEPDGCSNPDCFKNPNKHPNKWTEANEEQADGRFNRK